MAVNSRVEIAEPIRLASHAGELPDQCMIRGQCRSCAHDRVMFRRFVTYRSRYSDAPKTFVTPTPCLCLNCGYQFELEHLRHS